MWLGISWLRKAPLVFVSNKMDTMAYVKMLEDVFEPFIERLYPNGAAPQPYGIHCRMSKFTCEYFATASITDLECPHAVQM